MTESTRLSPGFVHEESIYFLVEHRVSRRRRPVWFIMPIERSPVVYEHTIYLYRYESEAGRVERLATIAERPPSASLQYTKFASDGDRVVFASQVAVDLHDGTIFELRFWDTSSGELIDPGPESRGPADSPLHRRYFAGYLSPWSANPGIVPTSDLRRMIPELDVGLD